MTKPKIDNPDRNQESGELTIAELDTVNGGTGTAPAQTMQSSIQATRHQMHDGVAQNIRG